MRIINLKAENVQRLSAVDITPTAHLNVIGGKNGHGKTSTLDAIWMAIAGKRAASQRPVRDGAEQATIEIELDGDYVIRRVFDADGTSRLEVRTKSGAKYPTPQALLDGFGAKFSFNPLEFKSLEPKKQAEVLRSLVGLDFADLDRQREVAVKRRTALRERAKELASVIDSAEYYADAPEQEVPVADTAAEIKAIAEKRNAFEQQTRNVRELEQQAAHLARERALLVEKLATLDERIAECQRDGEAVAAWLEQNPPPDDSAMRTRLAEIEESNARVRSNRAVLKLQDERRAVLADVALAEANVQAVDTAKAKALASAKFPVPGLSFDADGVTYRGIPFSQISDAEKLRVSVAMGIALNPTLRVLLVRDGSLLDDDNLALLAEMAAEHDAQVWLERVGTGPEVSIVIEDGAVREVRPAHEAEEIEVAAKV